LNLTFLNTAFLFAALAALLPLLIHLISRRRVATVDFSSLRFLKELERKRIRRVRLRQILLLIVRSLIILAAALALARPTLRGSLGGGGGHAKTSVAVVLDDSASMSRDDGRLFGEGLEAAREIADLLDDGDQAFLVLAGEPAGAALVDGTFSPDVLVDALEGLEVRDSATDYSRAVALARELLSGARNLNRELYLLGDLQSAGWRDGVEGEADAGTASDGDVPRAYVLPIDGPTMNLGIESVRVERTYGAEPGHFAVTARVSNHGRRRADVVVKLFVDGEQAAQAGVEPGSGGTSDARFAVTVDESGWHEGWVELPADALDTDNRHHFVIPAARRTEVLVVRPDGAGDLDDADYVERALDPGGARERFGVSVVDVSSLAGQDAGRFPVVVLADVGRLGDAAVRWLRRHVEGGGGLLAILGNRTDIRSWNSGTLAAVTGVEILAPVDRPGGVRLAPSLRGHPLLEGLVFGERLVDDISVRRAFAVRAEAAEDVLELPGVGPALVLGGAQETAPGSGEVAVLMTGIDPGWSDLPRSGFVVPLMHRLVERLSRTSSRPSSATVGGDLSLRLPSAPAGRVEVEMPDGRMETAELRDGGGPAVVVEDITEPGIYRFREAGRTVALGSVNVDPAESDLTPASRDEVGEFLSPMPVMFVDAGVSLEDQVLQSRFGRELWRAFLYVALVLLALEMYLARPRLG
jgi:hypothetical protein